MSEGTIEFLINGRLWRSNSLPVKTSREDVEKRLRGRIAILERLNVFGIGWTLSVPLIYGKPLMFTWIK